jgi:hypothetical protein
MSTALFDANERLHFIISVNRDFDGFAQYDWEEMSSASSTSIHPIFGVTVAVIGNSEIIMARTKAWIVLGITTDRPVLHFGLQRKPPRRDVVRILQREKETLQISIGLALETEFPLHLRKPTENIPVYLFNESETIRMTIAAATPQNRSERNSAKISRKFEIIVEPSA